MAAVSVSSDGPQKLKEIVNKLKDEKSDEFNSLLKRWEAASQMRKWTQSIKLAISERVAAEAEQAFRDKYNADHPSEDALTG